VLIKQVDDAAHHLAARVIRRGLRDRDNLDAVLEQPSLIDAKLDAVPEKSRQTMNNNGLKGRVFRQRVIDHSLKYRSLVVGCRGARLDVFLHHQMAVAFAPLVQLAQLVWDG
jgi:hypothetical protein